MTTLTIKNLSDIDIVARTFVRQIGKSKIIAFYGEMGAGKTTFINAITRQLGVTDDITNSPSFSIVNEYTTQTGDTIYHFDMYRLNNIEEAIEIGLDEYFFSGNICLIEWPERIEELLPEETLGVAIKINGDNSRSVIF